MNKKELQEKSEFIRERTNSTSRVRSAKENLILGIQLFLIFSAVRIFAIFSGVIIVYIPILDDLYFPIVQFIGSLNLGQSIEQFSFWLRQLAR